MDISDFVEQSLIQIINGVARAQKVAPRYEYDGRDGDTVNPRVMDRADYAPKGKYYSSVQGDLVQFVGFDIAVTVESGSEAKGSGGLKVLGIGGAEAGGRLTESTSSVSRIRFEVPIALPHSDIINESGRS